MQKKLYFSPALSGRVPRTARGEGSALPPIVTLSVGFADTSPKGEAGDS
ncbi:MAG: hypothetical protein J5860_06150 [Clostridia bacterium]|nr:hypothetical protein [Clostridia bacterium]